jgi:DNA-directed RNA polymerase II subunit RPB4
VVRKVREELQEYGAMDQVDEEGNIIPADDDHMRLSRFEMAQLANLNCEDVEEAKVLIPTLAPKDDGQLATLLNELATKRKFQT